jgi:hypothetical protein
MAHDVFVSYSSRDKAVANAVCATLESRRIRCWMAPRDVLPGVPYGEALIDAIQGSRVMVLVFSASANDSPQVLREVERAASKGIPIIPFRIEDVTPSKSMEFFISAPHWLDALTPPLEAHLGRLGETVELLLTGKKEESSSPPPPDGREGGRLIWLVPVFLSTAVIVVETIVLLAAWGSHRTSTPTPAAFPQAMVQPRETPSRTSVPMTGTAAPSATWQPADTVEPSTETPLPRLTDTRIPTPTLAPTSAPTNTPVPRPQSTDTLTPRPEPTATPNRIQAATRVTVAASSSKRLDYGVLNGRTRLYATDLPTGRESGIIQFNYRPSVSSAAWSPDGRRVLVSAYSWGSDFAEFCARVLRVVNTDGSSPADIAKIGPDNSDFSCAKSENVYGTSIWSPDGHSIATRYEFMSDYGVFRINSDGTGLQRVDSSDISDWPVFWSADGKWVIAVSSKDNALYALEVDGKRRLPLSQLGRVGVYDERYYPWRLTYEPACDSTDFWSCR